MEKKLVIGADHAGYNLKEKIRKYLNEEKIKYIDVGAYSIIKNDDYPDYALKVAKIVKKTKGRGILFCGSATGMAIAANKVNGIRAAVGVNEDEIILARRHNDINVLCLNGINYNGIGKKLKTGKTLLDLKLKQADFNKAKSMIKSFLHTKFEGGRHKRRLNKIKRLERI